jgi:hypothetical protein
VNERELMARNAPPPSQWLTWMVMVVLSPAFVGLGMVALIGGMLPRRKR